ncbi:nucleotide sugar dehydrogenase [Longirhabdus pacifica]|uniref:nucleotide sugar dehydrogenase n=1 Tax=Longirhabdus pacifica TaxID=2305227 RepID=UPI0010089464|nr:nucleotide sugar dehydrogenase [Longirhabdus pacifica]
MRSYENILKKIEDYSATLGVIGLGYVGLPLAVAKAQAGYRVVGFDVDTERVNCLQAGSSYIRDISSDDIKDQVVHGRLSATNDFSIMKRLDAISICVPTPIDKYRQPDLTYLNAAIKEIVIHLPSTMLIIINSTTFPGTTEEVVKPIIEKKVGAIGEDVFLAYSPERIDPGNRQFQIKGIPRIVGGVTKQCTTLSARLYEKVLKEKLYRVDSTGIAEMSKIVENTFRLVNIGLINELAVLCHKMNLDIWKVIEAASTKPYGYMPFYPGPGIGGHCIPVDPHYLVWKAKEYNYNTQLVEIAAQVNESMPSFVVFRMTMMLNEMKKTMKDSNICIIGAAYKKNVSDLRESPVMKIFELLELYEVNWSYHDPHIASIDLFEKNSVALEPNIMAQQDLVVIATDHDCIDYQCIADHANVIFDTRSKMSTMKCQGTYVKL